MFARRHRRIVVLAATSVLLVAAADLVALGCTIPAIDEVGRVCTGDCPSGLFCLNGHCAAGMDAGGRDVAGESAPTCTPPEGGDPCVSIPKLNGVQTVDCKPTEFCDVPVWTFEAPAGNASTATANLQVAWSETGLHLFVEVKKWPVSPATTTDLYEGDAIELFVAASSASLQGLQSDDAIHFVASPPPPGAGLGGQADFYQPNLGGMQYPAPLGVFVGCVIPNVGYDIEIQLPWKPPWLPKTVPPVSGSTMGFDFAIDTKPKSGPVIQTFEDAGPVPDGGTTDQCKANGLKEAPYCDDRFSCRPLAQ